MVAHQAVGMAEPAVAVEHVRQQLEELDPITVDSVNGFTRIAASRDVIDRAGKADSVGTSDPSTLRAASGCD